MKFRNKVTYRPEKKLINFRKWFGTYSEYQSVANTTTTVRLLGFIYKNGATAAAVLVQRLYQHASAARRNDTMRFAV